MNTMVKHLQDTFIERCRSNEQYSLRAFSRNLNVPVSTLSEIMNEKRPLTKSLRNKIGEALSMSLEQIEAFDAKEHGNSLKSPQEELEENYRQIALDSFYIISEWYHYGILQLIKTKSFKNDEKWIAKRLGLEAEQAHIALERLKRVGIIQEQADGSLTDITGGKTSHLKSDFTNEQLKNFQIKALEKSIHALKNIPIVYRDNTSMTMAISKEALPFAKEEIRKFRRQLTKKLETFGEPDEVYQLTLSLTPLTNLEITEE
jgi:uncharacterized protein (TIGR02147 family)